MKKGERKADLTHGLPMFKARDPALVADEKIKLAAKEKKGLLPRWRHYLSLTGPGWMQSALTLGSGSAMASLYLGAQYKFSLLWVQPLAMAVGIVMLLAASHQTLSTGIRPFDAMSRFVHPSLAWAWAIGTLFASFVFHLPQYALAAGVTEDMICAISGWKPSESARTALLLGAGLLYLVVAAFITWNYGSGLRGIRLFERTLKIFIWLIIAAFAVVVAKCAAAGRIDWGGLFQGFLPLHMPTDSQGMLTILGAFGAAVGINMTFLFGYSLLARGWGKEHRGLARFDLITGMLIPYTIATSLMVIAAGCTLYGAEITGKIDPSRAGEMIGAAGVGSFVGRFVFGLGVLGMALTTITLQMLVVGFAVCEIFGIEPGGRRYKLACLIPAPAFLGVILWKSMGTWIALPAFAIGLMLLPIPYLGWLILQNSRRFLGEDKPRGRKAVYWNITLCTALAITLFSVIYTIWSKGKAFGEWFENIF